MLALRWNRPELVTQLLAAGANVHAVDKVWAAVIDLVYIRVIMSCRAITERSHGFNLRSGERQARCNGLRGMSAGRRSGIDCFRVHSAGVKETVAMLVALRRPRNGRFKYFSYCI